MSPTDISELIQARHGEVFVLNDGGEVDLDLGNYERYLNITLTRENNITTGKIYQHVIEQERRGNYLGKTVQVVPHLTDAIQDWIERVSRIPVDETAQCPDICIIELGGTVGDIESAPFIEAMRQLKRRAKRNNFLQIHVSLVPVIQGEQKTKPTQQAIRDVGRAGLVPDLIACRCDVPLENSIIDKIAMFCQVEPEQVIGVHNVSSTYHVPLLLEKQGLVSTISSILHLNDLTIPDSLLCQGQVTWDKWRNLIIENDHLREVVKIALVGKYTNLHDSYLSVIKSLEHSAMHCKKKLELSWVDASHLEEQSRSDDPASFHKAWHVICTASGIIVPGGFGSRGTDGMIKATEWARTNKIPFLGVCFGMQIAVIEYARNVCGLSSATSMEIDPDCDDPVVIYMPEIDKVNMGGTMRLGLRPTVLQDDTEWSRVRKTYGNTNVISERHRHRYEINPKYTEELSVKGMCFVGKDVNGERMEIIELKDHPWFVGVQFHPEYLSKVLSPSPPYLGFIASAAGCFEEIIEKNSQP
ncbi:P-loop containing nucleoside triphosphate hydrolase [Erysiphe pulchra]|uniref:CTP synthase n=1 Tax=Erysiphe pulchra TaxID=225359 RepID=A0A2S4PW96_9PEZI|nr:P-loop containing nucleoside triphosphate hydrolase [Erysiphe pulchra]